MTLLVRDEVDIVAAVIEHHIAAGVDLIVATDNGSRDGTVEVLEAYRDLGVLELHHEPDLTYEQGRWVTRMARRAAAVHGADWVINADADEFFWPAGASACGGDALPVAVGSVGTQHGKIEVRRDNLLADPEATGGWVQRLTIRDTESLSARGTRIGPKTCHRADPAVEVAPGNHAATGPRLGSVALTHPLEIIHVPDRGYAQFSRKIANGGSACAANTRLGPEICWHWREDFARLLAGELRSDYARRQRDRFAIQRGLDARILIPDTRLRDRLTALLSHALVPRALRAVVEADS